eukprot:TCONS_00056632-protein
MGSNQRNGSLTVKQKRKCFNNKLAEKDNKMTVKENDFKMHLTEKDQEIAAKENEFKLKLADMENASQLKIAGIENQYKMKLLEKEKEISEKVNELNVRMKELKSPTWRVSERFAWGADKFFEKNPVEINLFASYQDWYKEISLLLQQGEIESVSSGTSKYVFIKSNCGKYFNSLWLITH